jgi:hypothetical protein
MLDGLWFVKGKLLVFSKAISRLAMILGSVKETETKTGLTDRIFGRTSFSPGEPNLPSKGHIVLIQTGCQSRQRRYESLDGGVASEIGIALAMFHLKCDWKRNKKKRRRSELAMAS